LTFSVPSTQQTQAIATVTESRRDALSSSSSASYIQPLALWSQSACVSSLLKLANSRILHNIVVIANPLVIAKTVLNLTKTSFRPTYSRTSSSFSFSLSISNYLSIIYLSFFHNICHCLSFLWWNQKLFFCITIYRLFGEMRSRKQKEI